MSTGPIDDENRPPIPDTSHLITETNAAVDNIFSEKQMRLLTEPLYASWQTDREFWVAANVGMYEALNATAIVPDVLLSLDTHPDNAKNFGSKCYFFWDHGKPPEVVIEIVSNKKGGELEKKAAHYEKLMVTHYIVFDPDLLLSKEDKLTAFELTSKGYHKSAGADAYPTVEGLGLRIWEGQYEGETNVWLRWFDERTKELIATGTERAQSETARAQKETARADALAAKLRELGVDPDSIES